MQTYTHAKDFLIELALNQNTYGWLKDLIIRVINTNGKLTDDDLSATKEQLKANGASMLTMPTAPSANASSVIRFRKLTHKSGVCALAPNQHIDFSEDVTLIYGSNGSGKSSYFRILNEMVGGNREISLRPNIYVAANPIDVSLDYTENGVAKTVPWNGTSRSIEPLNLSSVFDTEYSSTFLQRRSADEAIVMPYGLHLFTALTAAMDNVKGRLDTEIDAIEKTLPAINQDGFSEDVKRIISQRHYTTSQKRAIEAKYSMSDDDLQKLATSEQRLKQLVETNFDDKIKIATNERLLFEELHNHISEAASKLGKAFQASSELFVKIGAARKASEEAKAKIAILSEIGNTDSPEWKQFVSAGVDYKESSGLPDDICPYCRQKLTTDAKRIVSAYSDYLADKSQAELSGLLKTKESYKSGIDKFTVSYKINETLDKCIRQQAGFPNLYEDVQGVLSALQQLKETLTGHYAVENSEILSVPASVEVLVGQLKEIIGAYATTVLKLTEDKNKRDQEVKALKEEMKSLIEQKAISSQKDIIVDWFAKMHQIHELETNRSHLSTKSVSTLAKRASQQLVTDNLKIKFQEELNEMGLSKLHVNLEEASASRGRTSMQIHLTNNASAKEILSEGEQKGVALALFIAERRMQLTSNPIILDDPVNSLDHLITGKFIERLSKLNNQIIIFSHNILLKTTLMSLNDIHECGNNQRASCNKKSKHLFLYRVQSQGRDLKGVVTEGKQDNVKNHLLDAKRRLDVIPFTDYSSVTSSLRQAIELMIDEVVFNNQVPVKFHGKKNNINWDELKKLKPDVQLIDKLKAYYGRISGGDLHQGIEHTEAPIEYDELVDIHRELSAMITK